MDHDQQLQILNLMLDIKAVAELEDAKPGNTSDLCLRIGAALQQCQNTKQNIDTNILDELGTAVAAAKEMLDKAKKSGWFFVKKSPDKAEVKGELCSI